MSEPVGNSPRSGILGLQGNSHKSREAPPTPEPREKTEKIVTGKVVMRKPPFWKRMTRSIIADDAQSVREFLVTDVLIPNLKVLLYEVGSQALGRSLFGESRAFRRASTGGVVNGISTLRTKYDHMQEAPRTLSPGARARHDFGEISLDSRSEAVDIIDQLAQRIERYGSATVADLYGFLGLTETFADQRWGWTNLNDAGVRQIGRGFLLDLPSPEPLR